MGAFGYDRMPRIDSSLVQNNNFGFTNATPAGSFYRGRLSLLEFNSNPSGAKYKLKVIIELKGQEKPACIAEFLALAYNK